MHGLSEESATGGTSTGAGGIEHEQVGSITTGVAGAAGSTSSGGSRTRRSGLLTVMERPPGRQVLCTVVVCMLFTSIIEQIENGSSSMHIPSIIAYAHCVDLIVVAVEICIESLCIDLKKPHALANTHRFSHHNGSTPNQTLASSIMLIPIDLHPYFFRYPCVLTYNCFDFVFLSFQLFVFVTPRPHLCVCVPLINMTRVLRQTKNHNQPDNNRPQKRIKPSSRLAAFNSCACVCICVCVCVCVRCTLDHINHTPNLHTHMKRPQQPTKSNKIKP